MAFQLQLCAVVRKLEIETTLATPAAVGKRLLEPLKSRALAEQLPINILEDKEVSNEAEVHRHEADLWQCLANRRYRTALRCGAPCSLLASDVSSELQAIELRSNFATASKRSSGIKKMSLGALAACGGPDARAPCTAGAPVSE